MAEKLGHKTLAKTHNFVVALALGVKVCPTFSSTHWQCSKSILEDLLESKEFQDTGIDGRMESEATLVWTKCAVELKAKSTVDLNVALIVLPGYPEHNLPFRFNNPLKDFGIDILRVFFQYGP